MDRAALFRFADLFRANVLFTSHSQIINLIVGQRAI